MNRNEILRKLTRGAAHRRLHGRPPGAYRCPVPAATVVGDALVGLSPSLRALANLTPYSRAALLVYDNAPQSKKLAAFARGALSPKARAAAVLLAKARGGDQRAKEQIAVLHQAAQEGNPHAKTALTALTMVHQSTLPAGKHRHSVKPFFRALASAFRYNGRHGTV